MTVNLENPSHPHVQEGGEECPPAGSTGVRGAHVWVRERSVNINVNPQQSHPPPPAPL